MVVASSQRFFRPAFSTLRRSRLFTEQSVTKVFPSTQSPPNAHLFNHHKRSFSSLLSGKNSTIGQARKKLPTKQMPAATLAADPVGALQQTEAMLLERSTAQVREIAESVGVRLTPNELTELRLKLAGATQESMKEQMKSMSQQALTRKATREICLSVIASNENSTDKWGIRVINFFDYLGTALFAVVGTQAAGDAGMNLVGCTLVGCAAAMGGGSLNALLYGGTTPLLANSPGVRWVANPSFLLTAMAAAIVTFFGWPYYCQTQADRYIADVMKKENVEDHETISRDAFMAAWHHHPTFQKAIRDAIPDLEKKRKSINVASGRTKSRNARDDGLAYFQYLDADGSGDICRSELQELVKERFYHGWETYWLDTFGLTSLSIAAVVNAIRCGLHPIVACTSGVTVCFGGILRDLLCGRDLAIGSQSYAFATGACSVTYILLRELAIRRILVLPLVVRSFMAAGSCIGLRGYEFWTGKAILKPMHS